MFSINYVKNDNNNLFKTLEDNDIVNPQNYIPLYKLFFQLSQQNFNKINLNQRNTLKAVSKIDNKNDFICSIIKDNEKVTKQSFFKFSPLLDPIKFMVGKYKNLTFETLTTLPKLTTNSKCHKKIQHIHNTAYVDSFFSYLSSKVLHQHNIPHCLDFYGSFLGTKKNFKYNIFDDLEYLTDSSYFIENCDTLFKIENIENIIYNNSTRRNLKKINISDSKSDNIVLNLDEISSEDFDNVFQKCDVNSKEIMTSDLVFEYKKPNKNNENNENDEIESKHTNDSSSECSSTSSHTSNETNDNDIDEYEGKNSDEDGSDEDDSDDESLSDNEDDYIECVLYNFPIQIIALEKLENTLDSFLQEDNTFSEEEWRSCLFQIIITLIIYQKMFDFTHNDLHTNNIMFVKTDKSYLYYKYDKIYYKIPTFGKIWKIIDFGRAIYRFKGKRLCSDSFHKNGDAATQYNCEPFFNDNKPRLEPNKSFDLCRLGCSLYDFFIDDIHDDKIYGVAKIVSDWCKDDKGRNILYKNNGEERYPEFKLYKMIARTVHNYTPQKQIKNPLFEKFKITRKKINKMKNVLNIDIIPSYVSE